MSFNDFITCDDKSEADLASVFMYCRERPSKLREQERRDTATAWSTFPF